MADERDNQPGQEEQAEQDQQPDQVQPEQGAEETPDLSVDDLDLSTEDLGLDTDVGSSDDLDLNTPNFAEDVNIGGDVTVHEDAEPVSQDVVESEQEKSEQQESGVGAETDELEVDEVTAELKSFFSTEDQEPELEAQAPEQAPEQERATLSDAEGAEFLEKLKEQLSQNNEQQAEPELSQSESEVEGTQSVQEVDTPEAEVSAVESPEVSVDGDQPEQPEETSTLEPQQAEVQEQSAQELIQSASELIQSATKGYGDLRVDLEHAGLDYEQVPELKSAFSDVDNGDSLDQGSNPERLQAVLEELEKLAVDEKLSEQERETFKQAAESFAPSVEESKQAAELLAQAQQEAVVEEPQLEEAQEQQEQSGQEPSPERTDWASSDTALSEGIKAIQSSDVDLNEAPGLVIASSQLIEQARERGADEAIDPVLARNVQAELEYLSQREDISNEQGDSLAQAADNFAPAVEPEQQEVDTPEVESSEVSVESEQVVQEPEVDPVVAELTALREGLGDAVETEAGKTVAEAIDGAIESIESGQDTGEALGELSADLQEQGAFKTNESVLKIANDQDIELKEPESTQPEVESQQVAPAEPEQKPEPEQNQASQEPEPEAQQAPAQAAEKAQEGVVDKSSEEQLKAAQTEAEYSVAGLQKLRQQKIAQQQAADDAEYEKEEAERKAKQQQEDNQRVNEQQDPAKDADKEQPSSSTSTSSVGGEELDGPTLTRGEGENLVDSVEGLGKDGDLGVDIHRENSQLKDFTTELTDDGAIRRVNENDPNDYIEVNFDDDGRFNVDVSNLNFDNLEGNEYSFKTQFEEGLVDVTIDKDGQVTINNAAELSDDLAQKFAITTKEGEFVLEAETLDLRSDDEKAADVANGVEPELDTALSFVKQSEQSQQQVNDRSNQGDGAFRFENASPDELEGLSETAELTEHADRDAISDDVKQAHAQRIQELTNDNVDSVDAHRQVLEEAKAAHDQQRRDNIEGLNPDVDVAKAYEAVQLAALELEQATEYARVVDENTLTDAQVEAVKEQIDAELDDDRLARLDDTVQRVNSERLERAAEIVQEAATQGPEQTQQNAEDERYADQAQIERENQAAANLEERLNGHRRDGLDELAAHRAAFAQLEEEHAAKDASEITDLDQQELQLAAAVLENIEARAEDIKSNIALDSHARTATQQFGEDVDTVHAAKADVLEKLNEELKAQEAAGDERNIHEAATKVYEAVETAKDQLGSDLAVETWLQASELLDDIEAAHGLREEQTALQKFAQTDVGQVVGLGALAAFAAAGTGDAAIDAIEGFTADVTSDVPQVGSPVNGGSDGNGVGDGNGPSGGGGNSPAGGEAQYVDAESVLDDVIANFDGEAVELADFYDQVIEPSTELSDEQKEAIAQKTEVLEQALEDLEKYQVDSQVPEGSSRTEVIENFEQAEEALRDELKPHGIALGTSDVGNDVGEKPTVSLVAAVDVVDIEFNNQDISSELDAGKGVKNVDDMLQDLGAFENPDELEAFNNLIVEAAEANLASQDGERDIREVGKNADDVKEARQEFAQTFAEDKFDGHAHSVRSVETDGWFEPPEVGVEIYQFENARELSNIETEQQVAEIEQVDAQVEEQTLTVSEEQFESLVAEVDGENYQPGDVVRLIEGLQNADVALTDAQFDELREIANENSRDQQGKGEIELVDIDRINELVDEIVEEQQAAEIERADTQVENQNLAVSEEQFEDLVDEVNGRDYASDDVEKVIEELQDAGVTLTDEQLSVLQEIADEYSSEQQAQDGIEPVAAEQIDTLVGEIVQEQQAAQEEQAVVDDSVHDLGDSPESLAEVVKKYDIEPHEYEAVLDSLGDAGVELSEQEKSEAERQSYIQGLATEEYTDLSPEQEAELIAQIEQRNIEVVTEIATVLELEEGQIEQFIDSINEKGGTISPEDKEEIIAAVADAASDVDLEAAVKDVVNGDKQQFTPPEVDALEQNPQVATEVFERTNHEKIHQDGLGDREKEDEPSNLNVAQRVDEALDNAGETAREVVTNTLGGVGDLAAGALSGVGSVLQEAGEIVGFGDRSGPAPVEDSTPDYVAEGEIVPQADAVEALKDVVRDNNLTPAETDQLVVAAIEQGLDIPLEEQREIFKESHGNTGEDRAEDPDITQLAEDVAERVERQGLDVALGDINLQDVAEVARDSHSAVVAADDFERSDSHARA